ncbi:UDP-glucose--hexose-1-phosphate uridylyltransferase [Spirochaeta isovalerica]|uniref:Galactose-1-phosphate uridylyltransferase n=1 Tax=Spirochaeta isovalerica TaxID=150 RepID=A0A841R2A2_9SPIO|nr:UDP-glucose--hexose-1-phosphate uridylyltransferase [Spirochaeta isovalerica]MBB6479144.1 UDPglucose--hexose-1-phosphate uridylyltransferase [Spirochaeta isovalerica]
MFLQDKPHRRYNILTGEWIKVSPHRTKRPWQGQRENSSGEQRPRHDENCYLCPGNSRAGGVQTPDYSETYSFINDFAALLPNTEQNSVDSRFFKAESERGICKVICFSPRHDLTLPRMEEKDIVKVIQLWQKEYKELGSEDFINHVQIFENHGAAMGCSNPHPHGQIWADEHIPDLPAKELENQKSYYDENGTPMLIDYLNAELESRERLVIENDSFAVLVPFWAVWPYETMILPKKQIQSVSDLSAGQVADLAQIMKSLGIRYDNLFQTDFPYSMGLHQKPTDGKDHPWATFHMHYFPPLLRSAEVKKFMVGYEMMAMAQRDITAESSASILRELPSVHYREKN